VDKHRALLAIRTIDVTYRAALRHAPTEPGERQEDWLGSARQQAERLLNELESRLLVHRMDPEVQLQLRIARENIRRTGGASRRSDAP
jgi:hypothetical protein